MKHVVLASSLNVRANSNRSSARLALVPRFSVLEEISATPDRSWIRVQVADQKGWCSNDYLLREDVWKQPVARIAAAEFGTGEFPGDSCNPRIAEYQRSLAGGGIGDDEVAWCSSFLHWCVKTATGKPQKGITAAARSWKGWNEPGKKLKTTQPGCVAVLWRRDERIDAVKSVDEVIANGQYGHVALLAEPFNLGEARITLLGGNQGNRVSKATYRVGDDYGVLTFRTLDGIA